MRLSHANPWCGACIRQREASGRLRHNKPKSPKASAEQAQLPTFATTNTNIQSLPTMAKETSWFVGFTKRPSPDATPNTTSNSTPLREQVAGSEVDRLANQLSAGATIKGPDPEEERDPPPRPVPLVFPKTFPKVTVRWSSDHPPPNFQQLFASIQRPEAILTWHLRALNCRQLTGRSRDALLPWKPDGTSYFPTTADMMFAERIAELNITNDAAFRSLSKTTKLGDRAPRLAWTRKFWLALHNMSEYWCVDGEEYYDIQVPVKLGSEQPTKTVQRYKGRRTANGHDMPDSYRADTGKAFVESVTGAFLCRVEAPYFPSGPKRFAPSLQVGNLEQPVRLTAVVMRLPTDRDRYRAGFKEGPVMGVLERNTTHFGGARGLDVSWRKSEYDLLREIGAMLLIAQQRAHEGQAAPTRSEGEWYTTKPRWGGGSGSKLPALQQSEDDYKEILNRLDALERLEGGPPAKEVSILEAEMKVVRERHKRAQIQEQALKDMRPPPSLWHDKTDYKAIGKPRKAPYDEVSKNFTPSKRTQIH
jgi:hypothetical protein